MKKRNTHRKHGKTVNKLGMTYVELLCALSLLSLIVVMFTPMLLSSYEKIYMAGEWDANTYSKKESVETVLSSRESKFSLESLNMQMSLEGLVQAIEVSGKKAIGELSAGFETLFGYERVKVELLSPSTVYDDATYHEIILQTSGMDYDTVTFGSLQNYDKTTGEVTDVDTWKGKIHLQVIMPNKKYEGTGAALQETVYKDIASQYLNVSTSDSKPTSPDPGDLSMGTDGRITLKIGRSDLDFTRTPIQIRVYYVNKRGKMRIVTEYLHIEPATILFAGETDANADYYTSAGVQSETGADGETVYSLKAEARVMRTDNSPYLNQPSKYNKGEYQLTMGRPGTNSKLDIDIRSIRWIDNDEDDTIGPYYVMTGTNGAIYRMYNFKSHDSDVYKAAVGSELMNNNSQAQAYLTKGAGSDTLDKAFKLETGERIYSSLWGGDFSHAFEYSTGQDKSSAYGPSVNYPGGDKTWITSEGELGVKGAAKYNIMSPVAQFVYYANYEECDFNRKFKKTRPISYILTESGYALRLFGSVNGSDEYNGMQTLYDPNTAGSYGYKVFSDKSTMRDWANQVYAFSDNNANYYREENENVFSSISIVALASYNITDIDNYNKETGKLSDNTENVRLNYFQRSSNQGDNDGIETPRSNAKSPAYDGNLGYLRYESFDINITDAIYIPSAGGSSGSMFYVGNVHAYSHLNQLDKTNRNCLWKPAILTYKNDESNGGRYYRNNGENSTMFLSGALTEYLVASNDDGTGTYIAKFHNTGVPYKDQLKDGSVADRILEESARAKELDAITHPSSVQTPATKAEKDEFFFPTRGSSGEWKTMYMDDVSFTFGYSSNREKVYSKITYDGTTEKVRSFEEYYWISHYGTANRVANRNLCSTDGTTGECTDGWAGNNGNDTGYAYLNSYNNDYYNVWFPGEMYNLNKIASKNGVTVAVGYAVSGSTYQWMNQDTDNYADCSSTALGGIFNDGVLAAMVEGKDTSFNNLLYFKDNETMDRDFLSKNKANYTQFKDADKGLAQQYGNHSRDSVQFTAVDLLVEQERNGNNSVNLEYYAYYGDNKGRVFKSLVARGTGTTDTSVDVGNNNSDTDVIVTSNINTVPFIKDLTYSGTQNDAAGSMEEIKIGGESLSKYFKEINTIDATNNLVIISGKKADTADGEYFVVGVRNSDGTWNWRTVKNGEFTDVINDAEVIGGYYYIVGNGWMAGVSVDAFRDVSVTKINSASYQGKHDISQNKNELLWVDLGSRKFYAISGHATN
ncbi:MAG: hypothetical protein ACI4VW_04530 [Acutalibacteraceae bacterium]